MKQHPDAHALARELLGRDFEKLDSEEQRVLGHVAEGTFTGLDVDELAQSHASWGDQLADRVAAIGGSWGFIIGFGVVLVIWAALNSGVMQAFGFRPFDAYPFIFLNLMLSMLAAVQAPVILMSQNRQAMKDRITARHDYEVNLRTQLEILRLSRRVDKVAEQVTAITHHIMPEPPKE
jgi:uncharacterized membrane protein